MEEITLRSVAFQLESEQDEIAVINSLTFVLMLASGVDPVVRDFNGALSLLNNATESLFNDIVELNEKICESLKANTNKENE